MSIILTRYLPLQHLLGGRISISSLVPLLLKKMIENTVVGGVTCNWLKERGLACPNRSPLRDSKARV